MDLMDLVQLKSYIHSIRTPSELETKLPYILNTIAEIVGEGDSHSYSYYVSHTGRELYRKLWTFDLYHLIPGNHDGGFRPDNSNDIVVKAAEDSNTQLLCKYVVCQ